MEWLRSRKQELVAQIAIVDAELGNNHAVLPMLDDGGALGGLKEGVGGSRSEGGGAGASGVGVAADGHFILGLSSEAFRSTSVDEVKWPVLWFGSSYIREEFITSALFVSRYAKHVYSACCFSFKALFGRPLRMLFLFFVLRLLSKGVKRWAVSIGGGEIGPSRRPCPHFGVRTYLVPYPDVLMWGQHCTLR